MLKSIFAKQLAAYFGLVVVIFAALALVLNYTLREFFVNQMVGNLVWQGQQIANSYAHLEGLGPRGMRAQDAMNRLENDMRILETLGASAFVVRLEGGWLDVVVTTRDIGAITLDFEMLWVFDGRMVVRQVPPGDLFPVATLSVGYPIVMDGVLWGAIFMNAPMDEVEQTTAEAMRLVLFALLAAAAIFIVPVYFMSRRISRPIAAASAVAEEIAKGSFGKRLAVVGTDEIGRLAQSFNHMAQSLDETEQRRREFIANISHDLRSPLTSMQGFLQAMADGTIPEREREKYLEVVLTETKRLARLTGGILELNKIQGQEMELTLENFDINEVLRQTALAFEAAVSAKKLDIEMDFEEERFFVHADKEAISRVVYNLIDNAVKFTPEGGKIKIVAQKQRQKAAFSDKIVAGVCDFGIGMEEAVALRSFDRFFKADAARGAGSGIGLGLAIAKELVAAHEERIWVESKIGAGSCFWFTLTKN